MPPIIKGIPLWVADTNEWIVSAQGAGGECVLIDAPSGLRITSLPAWYVETTRQPLSWRRRSGKFVVWTLPSTSCTVCFGVSAPSAGAAGAASLAVSVFMAIRRFSGSCER